MTKAEKFVKSIEPDAYVYDNSYSGEGEKHINRFGIFTKPALTTILCTSWKSTKTAAWKHTAKILQKRMLEKLES
jgi:hypothetical protein